MAACSGGGTGAPAASVPSTVHGRWNGKVALMHIRLHVPSKHTKRRAHYLPSSAATVSFVLTGVNGGAPPSGFDFSFLTSTCTPEPLVGPTGYLCQTLVPAPVGADEWAIQTTDSASKTLSESSVVIDVTATAASPTSFTLDPVVAATNGLMWTSGEGYTNGAGTPTVVHGKYVCTAPGGCYDPLLNTFGGVTADLAALQLLDSDGNVIVPAAGNTPVSGAPYIPIYLQQNGSADTVTVTCNDGAVEFLNTYGYNLSPIPAAALKAIDFANGFSNTGAGGSWSGPGNGSPPSFNSPVTTSDGTSGGGTDFGGHAISGKLYGNNGVAINFDGTGSGYGLGPAAGCTATDLQGNSATYYLGLELGSIGWGSNGARR
ncbi:MAG: hypothetical protein JO192_03050 [Candidatus Eremiobacteraeota bacterium]|nr:hypothetical protein [Candidatus Eremiobacteraeota bacterium]